MERRTHWGFLLLAWVALFALEVSSKVIPPMELGFVWDYNKGLDPPVLVTEQCERIHIRMSRGTATTGPNPVPPYNLHVLTSGPWLTPFVINLSGSGPEFDWDVPFPPGTIYQACMFDANGVSGGCQDKYTVIKNTTVDTPTCKNITFPPLLDVDAKVAVPARGPMSQHGFIPQCTDLSVQPKNGTPPFTLLIAPSLRPPFQIVSNTMDPITWTVSLSFNFPFFLSLTSKDGLMWAFGPEHSASPGPDDCLAPRLISPEKARRTAVGAGVGSLFAGLLIGILGAFLFWRFRLRDLEAITGEKAALAPDSGSVVSPSYSSSVMATQSSPPLSPPRSRKGISPRSDTAAEIPAEAEVPLESAPVSSPEAPQAAVARQPTFVLHQDSGYVFPAEGSSAQVVDLPPQYMERNLNSTCPRLRSKS